MLPIKNRTITILTLTTTGEKRAFVSAATGVRVYINQSASDLKTQWGSEGATFLHKMLTDGNHATIGIGDRITDDTGKQYDVQGKSTYKDLTGTHHQYDIVEAYE